jgi:ABC-type antimicrobial peptide transport system permease subunit
MRGFLDRALGPRRFNLGLIASFALVAVLLAVSGLYGLVSCAVTERVPEIGLRIAIGATLGDVRRMILGQAARLGLAGSALGLALAAAVRPPAQGLVQDAALHPALVAGATSGLLALSLLAAWLPARRASRIDPVRALRAE